MAPPCCEIACSANCAVYTFLGKRAGNVLHEPVVTHAIKNDLEFDPRPVSYVTKCQYLMTCFILTTVVACWESY